MLHLSITCLEDILPVGRTRHHWWKQCPSVPGGEERRESMVAAALLEPIQGLKVYTKVGDGKYGGRERESDRCWPSAGCEGAIAVTALMWQLLVGHSI